MKAGANILRIDSLGGHSIESVIKDLETKKQLIVEGIEALKALRNFEKKHLKAKGKP